MMNKKFKVLTFLGNYVDESRLCKGIYTTSIPNLYKVSIDLDTIISECLEFNKRWDGNMSPYKYSDVYIDNLKQCELVDVEFK